jgi:hypothetical protein
MLIQGKDQVVTELERIVTTELTVPCTFVHANLFAANFELDQLEKVSFPVFVFVAQGKNRSRINVANNIIREVDLYGLMLQRKETPTSDYKSGEVNDAIFQMYQLSQNLMYQINKSPLSRSSNDGDYCGVNEWQADEIYSKFDVNLFGHGITFTWTVNTGVNGYHKRFGAVN